MVAVASADVGLAGLGDFGVFAQDDNVIYPNWEATGTVDHTEDYADVTIEIFDDDGTLNFADNQIDVSTGPHGTTRALDLFLRLHTPDRDCDFSGDTYGNSNEVVRSLGNEGTDVGDVFFKIAVSEQSSGPGLHVGCMHSPLWPQPGAPVTITASSFGDQPDGQPLPPVLADRLEVWFSTDGGVTRQIAASTGLQTTFTTNRVAGANGSTFSYGCRLVDGGVPAFSGWRSVQVGDPPQGRAVPVLLSDDREDALDFILFPATMNARRAPNNPADANLLTFPTYSATLGAKDGNFQTAAAAAVDELFREQSVLDNQRRMNIWLARDGAATGGSRDLLLDSDGDGARDDPAPDTTGDGLPDGDGTVDTCQHILPPNLGTDYGFGNVRAIVHPATPPPGNVNTLRECAAGGVFSAEATEAGVFIHETGHAGWGLADEYCCDGGYYQPNPNPNTYRSLKACQDDVESLGGVDADCRGMDSVFDADVNPDCWVSDPAVNDLMVDNRFARRANRRRMAYVYDLCVHDKC